MNPRWNTAILEEIDSSRDALVELLRQLVSFPSVTGREGDIQAFIAEWLRTEGIEIDVWEPDLTELQGHPAFVPSPQDFDGRPNVVGRWPGTGGGQSLLLNGHVDVIPPGVSGAWTGGPWSGVIEGTRMYGRGTSDMKSGLAAMLTAVAALRRLGFRPRGDLTLEFTVDEEATGNGTLACVLRGYRADAGICCETSSLEVQPACIGRIWFTTEVPGRSAGIQRSWEGVNAIEKGHEIVKSIAAFGDQRIASCSHPLYPEVRSSIPCMVCVFEAGTFPSAFPDRCMLRGSIATLPGEETDVVKAQFVQHIEARCSEDPWLDEHPARTRFDGYCGDPAEIDPSHPIVQTLQAQFEAATGRPPSITGRQGAADTRYLIRYGDTPTVIFGPGNTSQMHASNEWVDLEDLLTATKVLALTVADWCGAGVAEESRANPSPREDAGRG
jgi:acetylornithine deacetylase